MILENIRFGEKLETKKEYYKAYWVYMYAESAVDREDEAMCLIGSRKAFEEAETEADSHRRRIWKFLTDEEKENARQGINPFYNPVDFQGRPKSFIPYDLEGYYVNYVNKDTKGRSMSRKESRRLSFLLILIFFLHPLRAFKG